MIPSRQQAELFENEHESKTTANITFFDFINCFFTLFLALLHIKRTDNDPELFIDVVEETSTEVPNSQPVYSNSHLYLLHSKDD